MEQISQFELASDYSPTGDQPQAIDALVEGVKKEQFKPYLESQEVERHSLLQM